MTDTEAQHKRQAFRRAKLVGVSLLALLAGAAWAQPDQGTDNKAATQPGSSGGPPETSAGDAVSRGRYLVTLGDCAACHTVDPKKPLAGGLYMNTPFGTIPTPNLTPDKETGLGNWTDDQFYRALHEGIDNEGHNLYPAFPYEWFTHVTKDDVLAIKAYLFSLQPIHAPRKPLHMVFPFNVRAAIGPWNALYFKPATFQPDSGKSAEWNRGAYLAEGLGHCSDCHTPKNVALAPITSQAYAGNRIDNWYAPNLTSDQKEGLGAWSENDIVQYLKTGQARGKTVAIGPMSQTIHESTSKWTDADLHAIAIYIKAIPAKESYKPGNRTQSTAATQAGLEVYSSYCASCHQVDGRGLKGAVPALAANGAVTAKGPQDVIRAILGGVAAQDTYSPMPGFATELSPEQIADVTNYVRTTWGNGAPATATGAMVSDLVPQTRTMLAGTSHDRCTQLGDTKVDQAVQADQVQSQLKSMTQPTMLNQITTMIGEVRKAAPDAKQSEIINALTAAYCPVVIADNSVPREQKAPRLDQFSVLVYTQITDKGKK